MSTESTDPTQQTIQHLVQQSGADPSGWFEALYASAQNNPQQVPWATLTPNSYLLEWLDRQDSTAAPRSAIVVGCGLGDDAEALARHTFLVTAFDISASAIAWCQQRFPDSTVQYVVADVFQLPPSWHQQFDLVFESRTVQALPLRVRSQVMKAIAQLVAPNGILLVDTQLRDSEAEPGGPPWPLSKRELDDFQSMGLHEIHRTEFSTAESRTAYRVHVEYRRDPVSTD